MATSDMLGPIGLMVNGMVIVIFNAFESCYLIKLGQRRKGYGTLILSRLISDCFVGFGKFASKPFIHLEHYQPVTGDEKKSIKSGKLQNLHCDFQSVSDCFISSPLFTQLDTELG